MKTRWSELDHQTKADLLAWYNVRTSDVTEADRALLADLFESGRFKAWDCPGCTKRVYVGEPEDWNDFQGVLQADYTSYPGDSEKYQPTYLERLCDSCCCDGA